MQTLKLIIGFTHRHVSVRGSMIFILFYWKFNCAVTREYNVTLYSEPFKFKRSMRIKIKQPHA